MASVRTYIIETEFAKIDNPQSATTYIVLDDNDPTLVNKVVFKTNNINKEGEIYTVQNGQPAPVQKTCKFKFNSDGSFKFIKAGIGSYYLKVNDGEWTEYTTSQTVSVINGDVIELKSDVKQLAQTAALSFSDKPTFSDQAVSWELEGDLIGTLYGDTFPVFGCYLMFNNCTGLTKVPNDMFANYTYVPFSGCQRMFLGCTSLTTAPTLPATTLGSHSYDNMFGSCTSLTTAPELPATNLGEYCYNEMFAFCKSLTTAPELPATTLASNCYNSIFKGCTSLTTAPELPATTLTQYSYSSMFEGCTSLTTAPELPATTILNSSYRNMFKGCTSLNYVKCLATSGISTTNLSNWLSGVAATGTFVKAANASYSSGASGIPSGWTVEDAA